jgi:hypothetical protein
MEPVWKDTETALPPAFEPQTVQLVASRYTDYTISAHELAVYYSN